MARLQLRRGLKSALPSSGMLAGEPLITTDRGSLHVATDATTKLPVVPAIDDLVTLASITGASDLLIMHDADGTGQKEKRSLSMPLRLHSTSLLGPAMKRWPWSPAAPRVTSGALMAPMACCAWTPA